MTLAVQWMHLYSSFLLLLYLYHIIWCCMFMFSFTKIMLKMVPIHSWCINFLTTSNCTKHIYPIIHVNVKPHSMTLEYHFRWEGTRISLSLFWIFARQNVFGGMHGMQNNAKVCQFIHDWTSTFSQHQISQEALSSEFFHTYYGYTCSFYLILAQNYDGHK